jgi:hypothetical protein
MRFSLMLSISIKQPLIEIGRLGYALTVWGISKARHRLRGVKSDLEKGGIQNEREGA